MDSKLCSERILRGALPKKELHDNKLKNSWARKLLAFAESSSHDAIANASLEQHRKAREFVVRIVESAHWLAEAQYALEASETHLKYVTETTRHKRLPENKL